MWFTHWGLNREPFADGGGPYVPLPSHEEAVARLAQTIDSGGRLAVLTAPAGMGKSRVLARALALGRSASRRFALVKNPLDGEDLAARLAEKLGVGTTGPGQASAWRALQRACRLCALQDLAVVLALDGCGEFHTREGRRDLLRLVQGVSPDGGRVTVILTDEAEGWEDDDVSRSWTLVIRLRPLSASEVEFYLATKLAAAGCREAVFTSRAISRLQLLSGGSPRGLDRLGTLCLMAGASRGVEAVSSELVESIVAECHVPADLALRS
ncbi:MAG: AAA family ATPase [Isosphaeraceae bacterium]